MKTIEPFLSILYRNWWSITFSGLDNLPKSGPALIVGNSGGGVPWPAFMLMYALISSKHCPRRLNILANLDWIENKHIHRQLTSLGFVPWSADNVNNLFERGELVALFPESAYGTNKPFSERYRLREFDWTLFLPVIEKSVPVFPLATLGADESVPVIANLDALAHFLGLPSYPVTPFFPWLPVLANLLSFPVKWKMHLLKGIQCQAQGNRDQIEENAIKQSRLVEGAIQAELNRLLRQRFKQYN